MKIFLVAPKSTDNTQWDFCDGIVVAAENEEAARNITPNENKTKIWFPRNKLRVTYIGEARPGMPAGIVLSSFVNG